MASFLNTMTKHFEYNLLPFYLDDTSPSVAHLIRSRSLSISFRKGYVLCPKMTRPNVIIFRGQVSLRDHIIPARGWKKLFWHPDLKEMRNNCKEIVLPCIKFEDRRPPPLHTQENCFAHSIRWLVGWLVGWLYLFTVKNNIYKLCPQSATSCFSARPW